MKEYPNTLAAAIIRESSHWMLGDALLNECGSLYDDGPNEPKLREAQRFLADNGIDIEYGVLQELRTISEVFTPAERSILVSWSIRKSFRKFPDILQNWIDKNPATKLSLKAANAVLQEHRSQVFQKQREADRQKEQKRREETQRKEDEQAAKKAQLTVEDDIQQTMIRSLSKPLDEAPTTTQERTKTHNAQEMNYKERQAETLYTHAVALRKYLESNSPDPLWLKNIEKIMAEARGELDKLLTLTKALLDDPAA